MNEVHFRKRTIKENTGLHHCITETLNSFRSFTRLLTFALEYEERFD